MSFVVIGDLRINEEDNLITWALSHDVLKLLLQHEVVRSGQFNIPSYDKVAFYLRLNTFLCIQRGPDRDRPVVYKKIWLLCLCCTERDSSTWKWHYEVSILKNDTIFEIRRKNDFMFPVKRNEESILLIPSMVVKNAISSLDNIKIQCKLISAQNGLVNVDKEFRSKFNFERMFLDKKFSDVLLRTKCGKEVPAHKIVLATASPVFEAMFTHDMLENKHQLVDIVDISYDTVVEMLRYIYTGSVKNQEFFMTAELMAAANKYQLQKLKNKCEHLLGLNLSPENAVDALKIADDFDAEHLKKKAVDFVKSTLNETLRLNEMSDMLLGKKRKHE
ncbi:hypothetical protein TKK_0006791 [Trichogramma kaykai]